MRTVEKHASHEWKPFDEDETLEYCERCGICTCCSPQECSEPCTAGERRVRQFPEVDDFAERMRAEMVANAHKGDNWRSMTPRQAWGEISWHLGKLTAALKAEDVPAIRELAADIANGAMMLDHIVSAYDARAAITGQEGEVTSV